MEQASSETYVRKTRLAVLWHSVLNEPLIIIYSLLAFILHKDLNASVLQIAVLIQLKPVVALFTLYWGHFVSHRPERLIKNLVWAGVLGRLPFFFFPFLDSVWMIIAAAALYMLLYRSAMPAWMEIFKRNVPGEARSKLFSKGLTVAYLEGTLLAVGMGSLMDSQYEAWRWVFPIGAALGILGVIMQARVPVRMDTPMPAVLAQRSLPWKEKLLRPWRDAWNLMRQRPDFCRYQWGFMLSSCGLMMIQPILPFFFVDMLQLSYTDLAVARSVCMALGFVATSSLWSKWINRMDIYSFSSIVGALFAAFIAMLLAAQFSVVWVFAAYALYGVAQAGSRLSWYLSGPIFAQDADSSLFSSVNIVTVGLRGCVAPPIGWLLYLWLGPYAVLAAGFALCSYGGLKMRSYRNTLEIEAVT